MQFDQDIQKQLVHLALDDASASDMLPNVAGGEHEEFSEAWRAKVCELIEMLLDKGLVMHRGPAIQPLSRSDLRAFLDRGDPHSGLDRGLAWNCIWFSGTELLTDLLRRFDLYNWEALRNPVCVELGREIAILPTVHESAAPNPSFKRTPDGAA